MKQSMSSFQEWKEKRSEGMKVRKEGADEIERYFSVPLEEGTNSHHHVIKIHCTEEDTVEVDLMSAGSAEVDVRSLRPEELEALAKTRRTVKAWVEGERPTLPTAKELKLRDVSSRYRGK